MFTIEDSVHMGGYLVGLGKIKANGEKEFKFLDKPIKNKIVSSGLNYLMSAGKDTVFWNVGSDTISGYRGASGPSVYTCWDTNPGVSSYLGCLYYSQLGTSGAKTDFENTTDLISPILTKSSTHTTGSPFRGTYINDYGKYSMRVTHTHDAVTEETTVREIGWFGRVGTTGSYQYPLFARVVLVTPVTLQAGEKLITTYQLDLDYAGKEPYEVTMSGLVDGLTGEPLKASKKLVIAQSSDGWNSTISAPYIRMSTTTDNSTGSMGNSSSSPYYNTFLSPTASSKSSTISYGYQSLVYHTSNTTQHPSPGSGYYSSSNVKVSSPNESQYNSVVKDYRCSNVITKYRDCTITCGTYWPGMSDPNAYVDIYGISLRGYQYIFGYWNADKTTFTRQCWRKYANQSVTFTYRTRYMTEDTTNSVLDGDPANPA